MSSALKQLEEYRKKQSQRFSQPDDIETDRMIDGFDQKRQEDDEERRNQEQLDMELARKLQEDLYKQLPPVNEVEEESAFQEEQKYEPRLNPESKPEDLAPYKNEFPEYDFSHQQMHDDVRSPDQLKVDKLIPDESDMIQDEFAYQQFLLQQQLLLQDIEARKKSRANTNNQQYQQTPNTDNINEAQQPLLEGGARIQRNSTDQFQPQLSDDQLQLLQELRPSNSRENRKRLMIIFLIAAVSIILFILFVLFFVVWV